MASLVLTVIGPDRVGLVGTLSSIIDDHGGNWVESNMASLAGQFAGILRVDVPADRSDALISALSSMDGFEAMVRRASEAVVLTQTACIELVGTDHPGIVRAISETLAAHGINVQEFESDCIAAPMSGEPLFQARATVSAPEGLEAETLRDALEQLANDLMVEIKLD